MIDLSQWRANIGSWHNIRSWFPRSLSSSKRDVETVSILCISCVLCLLLLHLSGDIELNPGPIEKENIFGTGCYARTGNNRTLLELQEPIIALQDHENFANTLKKACHSGTTNEVRFLVDNKYCDINEKYENGNTPLHLACQSGHLDVVQYLTNHPNCDINKENKEQNTPLHLACISGKVDIVRHLVEDKKCNINGKGNFGYTPLHWACFEKHFELVKYLTKNPKCNKNIQNNNRKRPIQIACEKDLTIVKYLLEEAKCNAKGLFSKDHTIQNYLNSFHLQQTKSEVASLKVVKCLLTGPPGAGKSTLKKRLLNESLIEPSLSTGVVDAAVHVDSFRKLSQQNAVVSTEWREQSITEEIVLVQASLLPLGESCDSDNYTAVVPTNSDCGTSSTIDTHLTDTPDQQSSIGLLVQSRSKSLDDGINTQPENIIDGRAALSGLISKIPKKNRKIYETKYKSDEFTSNSDHTMLHIIDTGGQPEFHEILPALITGPAINLLVFKLTEDLRSRYDITYRSSTGDSVPYETSLTHEEVIFRSLASISCLRQNTIGWNFDKLPIDDQSEPAAFLIATHKDCVDDSKVNEVNEHLKIKISSSPQLYDNNLVKSSSLDEIIFPLDTTKDEEEIEQLRSRLHEIISEQFTPLKVPASWCTFSITLRKSKKKLFKYDACYQIAQECGIKDKNDFQSALWYLHHRVGSIMYYPEVEGLEDIIITNLQLVFDRITNLITTCFTFAETHNPASEKEFRYNGRFSEAQLDKISHQKGDPLTHKRLVALLKHLYIVAGPMKEKVDRKTVNYYFMPCALKPTDVENEHRDQSISPAPLLISFECGYTPVGVFCCLIVYLLSSHEGNWSLAKGRHYRNKITFEVSKYNDTLVLISRATYLEVWVKRQKGSKYSVDDLCQQVLSTLHKGLVTVTESLHYTYKSDHTFGFPCTCTLVPPHPAVVNYNEEVASCSCNNDVMYIEDRHIYWSKKIVKLNEEKDKEKQSVSELKNEEENTTDDGHHEEKTKYGQYNDYNDVDIEPPQLKQSRHTLNSLDDNQESVNLMNSEECDAYFSRILNITDLNIILQILPNDFCDWQQLGLYIGLSYEKIQSIDMEQRGRIGACLRETLAAWLKQSYDVMLHGKPTWRQLIEALEKLEENSLAETITRKLLKRKRAHHTTINKVTKECQEEESFSGSSNSLRVAGNKRQHPLNDYDITSEDDHYTTSVKRSPLGKGLANGREYKRKGGIK